MKTFDREQDGVKSPNGLERGIMEPGYSNLPFVALKSQFNLVLNYIKTWTRHERDLNETQIRLE